MFGRLSERRDRMLRRALRIAPPGLVPVAIDARCAAWLGLEPHRLFLEAMRRRIWLIPLSGEDLERSYPVTAGPPSPAASDTAQYSLCIRHEMLPDELAAAIRASEAMATEYQLAIDAARQREATFDRLASRLKLQAVVYMQGYTPIAAAMRAVATRRRRGLLALENTLFHDRVTWDDAEGIACFTKRAESECRGDPRRPVIEADGKPVWQLERSLSELKSPEHRSGARSIAIDGPYILFLGQVFTDASIVFGCDPGWGPIQVIDRLRRWLPAQGLSLVVKAHPKEAGGSDPIFGKPYDRLFVRRLREAFKDLATAAEQCIIDVDNTLDTYAMIRSAACVVTMNSQAGIEAAAMGVPTIVCARAHYAGCGFTYRGTDAATLVGSLQACLASTPQERLARRREAVRFVEILRDKVFVPRTSAAIADLIARVAGRGLRRQGASRAGSSSPSSCPPTGGPGR